LNAASSFSRIRSTCLNEHSQLKTATGVILSDCIVSVVGPSAVKVDVCLRAHLKTSGKQLLIPALLLYTFPPPGPFKCWTPNACPGVRLPRGGPPTHHTSVASPLPTVYHFPTMADLEEVAETS
jgi:hypothetical protein